MDRGRCQYKELSMQCVERNQESGKLCSGEISKILHGILYKLVVTTVSNTLELK